MFRQLLDDIQKFLGNPQQIVDEPSSRPFRTWLAVLTVDCIITIALILPLIYLIDEHVLLLRPIPEISEPMTFWFMVIIIAGLAPVVEELIFRYPLKFIQNRGLKVAVYLSSIAFGLYHLSNYANQEILFYALSPIIVGSQLLGGFLLAYLRLKQGVSWSILAHATFNAMMIIPSALLFQGKTVIDYTTSDYTILVKEYTYLERPSHMRIGRTQDGIDTVIVRQMGLQTVLDSVVTTNAYYADNTLIDIDFKAALPISPDSLINLLRQEYRIISQTNGNN